MPSHTGTNAMKGIMWSRQSHGSPTRTRRACWRHEIGVFNGRCWWSFSGPAPAATDGAGAIFHAFLSRVGIFLHATHIEPDDDALGCGHTWISADGRHAWSAIHRTFTRLGDEWWAIPDSTILILDELGPAAKPAVDGRTAFSADEAD